MHQHRRQSGSPAPTSPGFPPQRPSSTRPPNREREREREPERPGPGPGPSISRGLGIDRPLEASDQEIESQEKPPQQKLDQIIQNFHTKAALVILHSRADLTPVISNGEERRNKWFNITLPEAEELRSPLLPWKTSSYAHRPPPLLIEIYLDTSVLTKNQSLVIFDDSGQRWDVNEALIFHGCLNDPKTVRKGVVLERWRIELGPGGPEELPADLDSVLPSVYKRGIIMFRALATYSKFLPAWKYSKRYSKRQPNLVLSLKYRILRGDKDRPNPKSDPLTVPLHPKDNQVVSVYKLGATESPAGRFTVDVTYRNNCDFRVDDSESLLSSRFMGADERAFKPSLPSNDQPIALGREPGSLPVDKRGVGNPDPGFAYGSLSTFHQVGPTTGASPISALRAARDLRAASPSSPTRVSSSPKVGQLGRVAALSGEGNLSPQRRPSISLQAFKAPPLSASPAYSEAPIRGLQKGVGGKAESLDTAPGAKNIPRPPGTPTTPARNQSSENAIVSSTSGSPRPGVSKFSSSFSNRKSRQFSTTSRPDEDLSSKKSSLNSSSAQTRPELPINPDDSYGSLSHDSDNIHSFIKELEQASRGSMFNKDRLAQRASTGLSHFQRMRDSNAALNESISSSLSFAAASSTAPARLPPTTALSISSSPGKAVSPHTLHTPAIPSRLSEQSVVDYDQQERPKRAHRLSYESTRSREPSSDRPETKDDDDDESNANAIDIPSSPRIFSSSFRRARSDTRPDSSANIDDDLGDSPLPFPMRSSSLGRRERSPPTFDEASRKNKSPSVEPDQESSKQNLPEPSPDQSASNESSKSEAVSGSPFVPRQYQPRFTHVRGRGSFGTSYSHTSNASSLGRGSGIPHAADMERDASGSGTPGTPDFRRGSIHKYSFSRHSGAAPHLLDEDNELMFAISDFDVSRRSLDGAARKEGNVTSVQKQEESAKEKEDTATTTTSGVGGKPPGNSPGGFSHWL